MNRKLLVGLAFLLAGLALCGAGLWLLFSPAQYAATARVKVEVDTADLPDGSPTYDPYFIQTTFEIIQSELVLSNVVINLDLNEVWSKKHNHGLPLKTLQSIEIIKNHLRLAPVRNTKFISITYYSDTPNEAAAVANAIANSYRHYRMRSRRDMELNALEVMTQQFKDEEEQILIAQTNLESLHEKFQIQDNSSTNHSLEQQPYWDKKRDFDQMTEKHKLFAVKIKAEKLSATLPETAIVQFADSAQPPHTAVGPNRIVGTVLFVCGLALSGFGFVTLGRAKARIA